LSSDSTPDSRLEKNAGWAAFFRRLVAFKTRTKLLGIFALMFAGLFYANTLISAQIKASNISIESQSKVMTDQTVLSDTISCFGAIKYWFAILDNGLKKNPVELPDESAEHGVKCDLDKFGNDLSRLESFSQQDAKVVEAKYVMMRNLPKEAMTAYITGDPKTGEVAMSKAYNAIAGIDESLNQIAIKLNDKSAAISGDASSQSEHFKKFPLLFLAFGAIGIAMASIVIFFNIFRPVENIISTMINASQDPHNTKDYLMHHEDSGEADEVGEVILALNSLLLQVHEGFKSTEAAQQESAAAARQLDAIFNSVADGLITVNAEGEIESLNKSVYSIFGYDRQMLRDKKIGDFFPVDVAIKYMRALQDFVANGSSDVVDSGPKEGRGLKFGDSEIPIELSVTSIQQDSGHPIFVNVIRDITYRKDLERQLLQAQKMEALGSLAGGIAHEINTPTQYVRDNLKFMQEAFEAYNGFYQIVMGVQGSLPDAVKEQIAAAEKKQDLAFFSSEAPVALTQSLEGVATISEIVGAIRGFSYPATDDISYVDLNAALKNTITVARNQWKPYTQVRTEFDENLPPVPCIPGKLTQVVLNLIVNATHAIEEKCKGVEDPANNCITVSTAIVKKKAVIKVSDSGTGIPKENIQKIFNPFFTTKEVGKGTGQGLSISYDIVVKKHGGTLNVESEVGKGTTFIIELPMDVENVKPAKKGSAG
jgi:PAS domain S-box-containing protein